ncbi:hypothetical protein JCM8208_003622 [Rhodotorula glutinis]
MATDPAIFSLPPEILVHALAQAPPQACSAFSRTSSAARDSVNCTALWRALHRTSFDDAPTSTRAPTTAASSSSPAPYDWAAQVKRRTQAEILIRQLDVDYKPVPLNLLVPLLDTLVDLAQARPPVPGSGAGGDHHAERDSLNERWLEKWVRTSGSALVALHPTLSDPSLRGFRPSDTCRDVPSLGTSPPSTPAAIVRAARARQLAAHLHVLATPSPLVRALPALRTAAKEVVYEQSNFRRDSLYGPFMNDGSGRVDWRKLEALACVCGANLAEAISLGWGTEDADDDDDAERDEGDEGGPIVPPRGWASTRAHSAGPVRTDPAGRDWAGVTHPSGWRGTYSFLHWPTWHHFNRHRDGPRPPSLAHEHEAVGDPMVLRLELLPEGEWPPEIDQPDLSDEALAEEDGDDDEDEDWEGASAGSSWTDEGSSDEDEQPYFTTTGSRHAGYVGRATVAPQGDAEVTPPTSLSGEVDEREKEGVDLLDPDDPPLSPEQLAALAAPPALGPIPAAPHTAASAAYPPLDLTFRPSSSTIGFTSSSAAVTSSSAAAPAAPSALPSTAASSTASTSAMPNPSSASSSAFPPLAFHGTSLPRLGFTGTFTNAPAHPRRASDRSIRGTVSLTPEGHVRWQYVIRYSGTDQWAMNGVQVGGPGSRYGVLGVWTSADRADEGPHGPFWYWPHHPSNADDDFAEL